MLWWRLLLADGCPDIVDMCCMCYFFFTFFLVQESLHVHRCQSCQQPERQIKQTTGELRVHSTSYDKGSCLAMA